MVNQEIFLHLISCNQWRCIQKCNDALPIYFFNELLKFIIPQVWINKFPTKYKIFSLNGKYLQFISDDTKQIKSDVDTISELELKFM